MSEVHPLTDVPTAQDILDAHERLRPYIHRTHIITSDRFDERCASGSTVYFKGEHLQKTGAFKARGALNAVLTHKSIAKNKCFVTHSSGNHGAALAWAARAIGYQAHIVMPSNAPQAKIDAVKTYGGIITFCEPTLEARETTAAKVQSETGAVLIHPYDNYEIIAGQATATLELLQDAKREIQTLFIPVGGGGLLAGAALANHYFGNAKVVGCEPEAANDAWISFNTGVWTPVEQPQTIADGLRTSLGHKNFPIIQKYVDRIELLTEEELKSAWEVAISRTKQLIEPSAAAGVAAALRHKSTETVGVMLCGGNMVLSTPELR
jgi:threonine dehydratase